MSSNKLLAHLWEMRLFNSYNFSLNYTVLWRLFLLNLTVFFFQQGIPFIVFASSNLTDKVNTNRSGTESSRKNFTQLGILIMVCHTHNYWGQMPAYCSKYDINKAHDRSKILNIFTKRKVVCFLYLRLHDRLTSFWPIRFSCMTWNSNDKYLRKSCVTPKTKASLKTGWTVLCLLDVFFFFSRFDV